MAHDSLVINNSTIERCRTCPSDSVKGDERPRHTY